MEYQKCVKCNKPKTKGDECPYCGVYYNKAETALAKKTESQLKVKERTARLQHLEEETLQEEPNSDSENKYKKFSHGVPPEALGFAALALLVIVFLSFISEESDDDTSSKNNSSYTQSSNSSSYKRTTSTPRPVPTPSYAEVVVSLLNTSYGNVCHAELNGFFSRTLKIDWTGNTKVLHSMKVLAEIGSVKEMLYNDGVRYFQFPNDLGIYNVIDWKTGEKTSISDRANYYFRNR